MHSFFTLALCGSLLISGSLTLTGCGQQEGKSLEVPELMDPVDATEEQYYAERRDLYVMSSYDAAVLPYIEELSFTGSGTVDEIYVTMGQTVKEGELLAELSNGLDEQYEKLLEQLKTMQENNAYNNRLTEIELEKAKLLGQDTGRQELLLRHAKELQELEENRLQEEIREMEEKLAGNRLTAPFAGTIAGIAVEQNNFISGGSPVFALADDSEKYIQCDFISDKEIKKCHSYYAISRNGNYELEYLPYSASELVAVSLTGEKLKSRFRVMDSDIQIGDYALVCLISNYRENVMSVPKTAVVKENGENFVYVVDGDKRVKTKVKVGVTGTMYTEIIEGLEEGACVYVR